VLRQTVVGMLAGTELGEHNNPGEATVHVLRGRVRLTCEGPVLGGPVW
jgi:quercetin dioxygenase-like cupin family protein